MTTLHTPCNHWNKLPVGWWLVEIDNNKKPYHIIQVKRDNQGNPALFCETPFVFEAGKILGYSSVEKNTIDNNSLELKEDLTRIVSSLETVANFSDAELNNKNELILKACHRINDLINNI